MNYTPIGSWVIIHKATGDAVLELFTDTKLANHINWDKYRAVPILRYLYDLNDRIKQGAIR